ncbi:MAG: exodeoxyribonuclease V subunit gamma [Elusimicrobiaceae bacterium]|nr:exodeoxyribonuclease V subunit gamma [Elusimicrobiaceae bacterium]
MELFYAHYPSLEQSFLRFIERNRRPLEPWLVVCASSLLMQRLKEQLARKQGIVANLHFSTASSLLYRLDSEAGPAKPIFPQDHLRDFLIKEILTEPGLNMYPVSRGFIAALKDSLRDLSDSLADPTVLEEQLNVLPDEGEFAQDKVRFTWLVRVYKRYLERETQWIGYRPYQHFFMRALSQVEKSNYLKGFSNIIFYGFYDMPGRQLELVHQIRAHYPVTIFAPYAKYPAYQFARKFFETNWLGPCGGGKDENTMSFGVLGEGAPLLFAPTGEVATEAVQIVSAADIQSEVFFVAKEILRLVEEENYAFSDIGVLMRSQLPYQDTVRRLFVQNQIPLNAVFSRSLPRFALGSFCLTLFTLDNNGFDRESVLAILASAYFSHPQKNNWRKLAEKSLVSLNMTQWEDLLPQTEGFDPDLLAWLKHCQQCLQSLAAPGPWAEKCRQARKFLADNLMSDRLEGKEQEIYQSICACIDSLAQYSAIRVQCRSGEFVRELTDALSGLSFNETEDVPEGVVLTDVLRARGLSFKVVFLLGVNEKVFPQLIPDDPILRDRYRYLLRDVLGYWISQKAERTQEERLLFFTALTAARERLYVSYACRTEEGKEQVPSVYVAELARVTRTSWNAEEKPRIGNQWLSRLATVPFLRWNSKEVSCALMLYGQQTDENYRLAGLAEEDISRRIKAVNALKQTGPVGAFDGFIQSGPAIFKTAQREGFSPSALQDLAACPMKYFFRKALHLADKEEVCSRHELSADKRGTAYHRILEDFYRELSRLQLTHNLFDTAVSVYLDRVLAKHYTAQSYRIFGIYPVVWELILEQLRTRLVEFVTQDLKQLGDFTPTYFEKEFTKLEVEELPIKLRGVIDRIDVDEKHGRFIIVDYKSSRKGTSHLDQSFFTHLIFQPFLYPLAAKKFSELKDMNFEKACLLSLQKGYTRQDLSAEELMAMYPRAVDFLSRLAQLVQEGEFFLNPSDLCAYCPYHMICRKDSFSCLTRARHCASNKHIEEVRYATR